MIIKIYKMKKQILLMLTIIVLFSCRKQDDYLPNNSSYFAFGKYYGFCFGNCAHFFSISSGKLYRDNMERFEGALKFNGDALSKDDYSLAIPFKLDFPQYLSDRPNIVIGEPDSHDQGSIYIELLQNGVMKKWTIDPDVEKQPLEIRNYISTLSNTIEQLK
jgi:hypothetical protein